MQSPTHQGRWLLTLLIVFGCQPAMRTSGPLTRPGAPGSATRIPPTNVPRLEIADDPAAPAPLQGRPSQPTAAISPGKTTLAEAAGAAWQPVTVIRGASPTPVAPEKPEATPLILPVSAPPAKIAATTTTPTPAVSPAVTAPQPKPAPSTEKIRELYQQAVAKNETIRDYTARFRVQEWVNGKMEQHTLMCWFANQPFSLRMKWLADSPNAGREVIYVKGKYGNQLQVLTGKADMFSGMRVTVDPTSERATKNSRRSITEAGMSNLLSRLGGVLASQEAGTPTYGTLKYLGAHPRPESAVPMECVVQVIPARREKLLPQGGHRYFFFNAEPQAREYQLPVLIVTLDEKGSQVEYYCYDRMVFNTGMSADDFNPDMVWRSR